MELTKFDELTTLFHRWKVVFFFFQDLIKMHLLIFNLGLAGFDLLILLMIQQIRKKTRSNNLPINKWEAL